MVWVSLCHRLRSKHSLLPIAWLGSNSLRLPWHSGESDVLLNRASMLRFITVSWPFVCKHIRENKIHKAKSSVVQVVSRLGTTATLRLRDRTECQIKEVGEVLDMLLCNTCTSGKSIPIPLVFPHWESPFGVTVTSCLSLLEMELSYLVERFYLVHKLKCEHE